ncbi:hypothetical protein J5893_01980 [bacterium]|nr:hypothetical protein [bacterium]
MPIFSVLAFLAGAGLGYLFFYLRFQYRDVINELRQRLKEANDQMQYLQEELDEFQAQNNILRDKASELFEKNDELNDVVAELSKYYVHIKRAAEKSSELSKILSEPDSELEEKIDKWGKREEKREKNKFF